MKIGDEFGWWICGEEELCEMKLVMWENLCDRFVMNWREFVLWWICDECVGDEFVREFDEWNENVVFWWWMWIWGCGIEEIVIDLWVNLWKFEWREFVMNLWFCENLCDLYVF